MKISNESKVGVLAAIAITSLILGFNFLKGKNLLRKKDTIYAVFPKVDGLSTSDAVRINGLQVGNVSEIDELDPDVTRVVVGFHLSRDVNIPEDSYAMIVSNPLGSTFVNIVKGASAKFVDGGDTMRTKVAQGMLEDIKATLSPSLQNVNGTLASLDSLLEQLGSLLDQRTKQNIQSAVADLATASHSLNAMLDSRSGAIPATLGNVQSITGNLRKNNDSITRIISNLEDLSGNLAALDLQATLSKLQAAADNLNGMIEGIRKGQGTMGMLMKDPKLYQNLTSTSNSLNVLLQDLRLHPKRYINVSVFGKKDKSGPLMQPLPDSATKAPDR